MTDHETSPQDANSPLNHMWDALLVGDPGPFVAFFDSLMNSDFPFGAGGLLRDLADRIVSATEEFEDESEREKFVDCLLYTSPSPRDQRGSRMPSSA